MTLIDPSVINQIADALRKISTVSIWDGHVYTGGPPYIPPNSMAHASSILGASIIQDDESSPGLWRPYEPNGRDCSSIWILCQAWVNCRLDGSIEYGAEKCYSYALAITNPERFLKFITQEDGRSQYENIIFTLFDMSGMYPLERTECPIKTGVTHLRVDEDAVPQVVSAMGSSGMCWVD